MADKGFMKKCQTKVKNFNRSCCGPHRAHKPAKIIVKRQQRFSFNTTELYIHTVTFSPEFHQGPGPLIWIANGLGKAAWRSKPIKTTSFWQ